MFLTKPYKVIFFSKWKNWLKSNKNSPSRMFGVNNVFASQLCASKVTSTPSKRQMH